MGRTKPRFGDVVEIPTGDPILDLSGAIAYLATVAYPEPEDSHKAVEFMETLAALRLRCCVPYVQHAAIHISVKYSRGRTVRRKIRKHFRRLERRLTAASIAWSLYWNRFLAQSVPQSSECSYRLELPSELGGDIEARIQRGPTTINKAVQVLVESRMKLTPGLEPDRAAVNIKHRYWAESLPVLHLAIPLLQIVGDALPKPTKEKPPSSEQEKPPSTEEKLFLLVYTTDWLVPAINYAESLRTFLPSIIPTFNSERAIRVVLA